MYLGKRVFADIIKDLKRRQLWIRVDPKSKGKCSSKTQGKGHVKMEAKTGVICLQAEECKECQQHQKLEGAWDKFALRASEGANLAHT